MVKKPLSKQDDLFLLSTLEANEVEVEIVDLESYLDCKDDRHCTKLQKIEIVDNEKYVVEVYKSYLYTLNLIKKKDSVYKGVEVKANNDISFVPKVYIDFEDDFDENRKDFKLSIQTTSYGSLGLEKFKIFLSIQNEAMEHVMEIEGIVRDFLNE